MKLRKGRARYRIPEHSQIMHVLIEGNQHHNQMVAIMLQQVNLSDIPKPAWRNREKHDMPRVFAIFEDQIEFYPTPDKAYVVRGRFTPPIKEF